MRRLSLGAAIRRVRTEKGLTLREVAERSHISVSFLSDIENGRSMPSVDTLAAIANALDVTVSFLMGEPRRVPTDAGYVAETSEDNDLPEEAIKELEAYKDYLRHKYGKRK